MMPSQLRAQESFVRDGLGLPEELVPLHELVELDRLLAVLGRAAGALRLRIGEALETFAVRGWHHELGFSSLGAYALERCGRGSRWAAESRTVAGRLSSLPLLRQSVVDGVTSWSKAELLARRATPDTERDVLGSATGLTVRQLRARLGELRVPSDAEAERRVLTVTVDYEDSWLFECTRYLIEHLVPGSTQDELVHALLAEATSTLAERVPVGAMTSLGESPSDDAASMAAWRAQRAAWSDEAEARCESRLPLRGSPPARASPSSAPNVTSQSTTDAASSHPEDAARLPRALDAHLQALCAELADRDLLLGFLADRFWRADGWRRLGYATAVQYARERLGLSLSSVKTRRILAARSSHLPALADAVQDKRIGYEAALIVSRVANRRTAGAWIARAAERTVKQLREEADVAELFMRFGRGRSQLPPSEATMRRVAAARCEATKQLSELAKPRVASSKPSAGQMSASCTSSVSVANDGTPTSRVPPSEAAIGSERGFGRTTLRLRLTSDTVAFWQSMAALHRRFRSQLGGSLVGFLCRSFWETWGGAFDGSGAYGHIYARDGYQCTNPTCKRRDVTPHHLVYRSRGGSDNEENLTSLCVWCHLEGVHGGRIVARPPAADITWQLGRDPIVAVHGRNKVALGPQRGAQ